MHLFLHPTTQKTHPLKIQHTTYDLVHPQPRNSRAQELNIRHTTHDSLSPLQPLLPQSSYRRNSRTHSSIPIPRPSGRSEREEAVRNGSLRKRVREYVRPKEREREREIPKIVLLQHTPTTPSFSQNSPPKIPPSDAEILTFLGMNTTTRARKTKRMEMEKEDEHRQATREKSRSPSRSQERYVSEVYSQSSGGYTDEERRGRSPAAKSRVDDMRNGGGRPAMPPRKSSKLLPPPPLRSFNSAPEQSHPRLPSPVPPKPTTSHPRTATHKRTPSSQSRTLSGYLTTGTAHLHAKRLSTLHQLSTSVTRATQLYRESQKRERERRRSDASSESVESFFCAGDSSAGERSVSPLGRKGDSAVEEVEGRCRLCGEGMDAWRERGSGLCRGCEGEFKRPVTRYGGDGGGYAVLSDKKGSWGRDAVREVIPPLPPIAPAYRDPSLSSRHEIQPTKTRRGNRTPSPHPLSKSPPRTTIPNMPVLNSSKHKDNGTVIVPAASTQHIAFQLRSPTLVNHSPHSSITTTKPNTKKKDVDGVWGKYHVSGMKQKERERYDASRVCRDSLFYELYDEVLNDYGRRSGEDL